MDKEQTAILRLQEASRMSLIYYEQPLHHHHQRRQGQRHLPCAGKAGGHCVRGAAQPHHRRRAANAIEHLVSDLQELHDEHTRMRFSGAVQIQELQNELAAKDRQIERLKRTRGAATDETEV